MTVAAMRQFGQRKATPRDIARAGPYKPPEIRIPKVFA
jgi:hypothetical protein